MNIGFTTLLVITLLDVGVAYSQSNPLLGIWKSDEEKTLSTIHKAEKPTEKGLETLRKGFFGRLVVEFRENDTTSYFIDDENPKKDYYKYKFEVESNGRIKIRYFYGPSEEHFETYIYISKKIVTT